MNEDESFFHTIARENYQENLRVFREICESKKILPPNKQKDPHYGGFLNNIGEICISKDIPIDDFLRLNPKGLSAVMHYTRTGLTLAFKGNMPKCYQPKVVIPEGNMFINNYMDYQEPITEFYDEYRTKEEISLENLDSVSYPFSSIAGASLLITSVLDEEFKQVYKKQRGFTPEQSLEIARRHFDRIKTIMEENNINVPITDGIHGPKIKKREDIKRRW